MNNQIDTSPEQSSFNILSNRKDGSAWVICPHAKIDNGRKEMELKDTAGKFTVGSWRNPDIFYNCCTFDFSKCSLYKLLNIVSKLEDEE